MSDVTHMKSYHTYEFASHVERVMSHVNKSRYAYKSVSRIERSHGTRMKSCHTSHHHITPRDESCHTYEWVTPHIWIHITRMNESCRTWMHHVTRRDESCHVYEQVMSRTCTISTTHTGMSHVTHMNESCHTHAWVMSHIWKSHVTRTKESCDTYAWVVSHVWMSHVTHIYESCHTYEWVMSHTWMTHLIFGGCLSFFFFFWSGHRKDIALHCSILRTTVPWLTHMCGMPHLYV